MRAATILIACLVLAPQDPGTRTYTDETHKYSVTYPDSMAFEQKEGKPGWFIFAHAKEVKVPFRANLNVEIEEIPKEVACETAKDYAKLAVAYLRREMKDSNIMIAIEPTEAEVNAKTLCKVLYSAEFGGGPRVLTLQYCFYKPDKRVAYVFTAVDAATQDLTNLARLEKVIQSIRFD